MDTIFEHLTEGMELTAEQREKFKKELDEAFKAAVDDKVAKERESIEESVRAEVTAAGEDYKAFVAATLKEANEAVLKEQAERIDRFTEDAAKEIFESFEKEFAERAQIEVAQTVVESVATAIGAYKLAINPDVQKHIEEAKASTVALNARIDAMSKDKRALEEQLDQVKAQSIVESLTRDLPQTKREVIEEAVKELKYETDEQYTGAVKTIVENRFPKAAATGGTSDTEVASINEQKGAGQEQGQEQLDENSLRYAKIFGRR